MRVLIVDDCNQLRNLIYYVVTSLGHTVVGQAKDGVEAVELARQLQPDVITMDLNMPRMNGVEAIRSLEAEGSRAKIIVITGDSENITVVDAKQVVKRLSKPFSLAEISSVFAGIAMECS